MTDVEVWGVGDRVVLVHGSLGVGPDEWSAQRPLAEEGWELVVPTRRSYAGAVPVPEDYAVEAADVVPLLGERAHLVGHSSGGMVAMLAAAARPAAVRSLTLVEPPAFAVAPDHPAVADLLTRTRAVFGTASDDRGFLVDFLHAVGSPVDQIPGEVLERLVALAPALRRGERAWDAPVPLGALSGIPTLVVSGGHHPAFTALCEALAQGAGGQHVVVRGAGHDVQLAGEPFNDALRSFWSRQA